MSGVPHFGLVVAVATVAAAVLVIHVLLMLEPAMKRGFFVLFAAAVMISGWYGLAAGLLATFLSSLASAFLLLPWADSLTVATIEDLLALVVFVFVAVGVSSLVAARRRSDEALRHAYEAMEQRVEERTHELVEAKARLEEEITERKKLRTLSQLTRAITSAQDRDRVFRGVAEAATTLIGARLARVWVNDPGAQVLRAHATFGADPHVDQLAAEFPAVPYGRGIVGGIVESREPEYVLDVSEDPRWLSRQFAAEAGIRGFAGLPLLARDRIVGVLAILFSERRSFSPEEKELMGLLADQAAIAIDNRHLFEAVEEGRRTNELILNSAGEGIYGVDARGTTTFVNAAAAGMLGQSIEELIGRPSHGVVHHSRPDGSRCPEEQCAILATFSDGRVHRVDDDVFCRSDGTSFPVEYTSTPIRDGAGALLGAVVTFRDLTERRELEAELRQSQKMDALGRLAGGIAHDFSNLLTVVQGRSELLQRRHSTDAAVVRDIDFIQSAVERANALIRQLLAFSRKQPHQPVELDLNFIVNSIAAMLQRLIGDDVKLHAATDSALWRVKADPVQLEQVLVNLAVNARDAMPQGGRLTLETANVELDETFTRRNRGARPGPHVVLAVQDTGVGMDADTQGRVFEPFFTTKGPGKGTGLGLSTVYGIVKQHGGCITVESAPGEGTAFRVYLPRVEDATEEA